MSWAGFWDLGRSGKAIGYTTFFGYIGALERHLMRRWLDLRVLYIQGLVETIGGAEQWASNGIPSNYLCVVHNMHQ